MPTLEFKGKQHIYAHHLTVPYRPLLPDETRSCNPSGVNDNLIIHGDNLQALKALLPRYSGRVKCIYIDPPYNTGNEGWIYNDSVNSPLMKEWLRANGPVDNEDLERHDKWLCMMWPRLHLLRDLLSDDGVILVSIDDNELHHLRTVMDEVFGENNFVGSFVWEGAAKNDARFISVGHDYILCYANKFEMMKENQNRWRVFKEGVDNIKEHVKQLKKMYGDDYEEISNELQKWYRSLKKNHKSWQHRHYNYVDAYGIYFPGDISWPGGGGPRYEVIHPTTKKPVVVPKRGWVFSRKEKMELAIRRGKVHFGPDEKSVPNLKRYLHETSKQVLTSVFYQDRRAAHQNLAMILGSSEFEYPKDERVIRRLLEVVTSDNDVVLDSFAGSGTTAHAVLALNREDGGNRRFILVECEDYAATITAERVRRVIQGVPSARDAALGAGLGGSFTYATLGDPIELEGMLSGDALPSYATLAAYLLYTTSGISAGSDKFRPRNAAGLFHTTEKINYHLFYQPDLAYLESNEAVLNEDRAKRISTAARKQNRKAVVFAAAKYIGQRELTEWGITFCQLPYELSCRAG